MKALVIGAGKSGVGVTKLLIQHGYDVTIINDGPFTEEKEIELMGGKVFLEDKNVLLLESSYDLVVKNPGISNEHPVVKLMQPVLNEIEVAYKFCPDYRFLAVSGTNGKTTTVTLLGEMLKYHSSNALVAGNIGIALSEKVYQDGNFKRDVALEISAFQMEGTPSFKPFIYTITNLTPDHLDRYDNVEDYYKQKLSLVNRSRYFIRNIDDENVVKLISKTDNTLDISLTKKADIYKKNNAIYYQDIKLFDINDFKLVGNHNIMNGAMASSMAYLAGVSVDEIKEIISNFKGVTHRLEYVETINGLKFYNDSKATNPESLEVCLKSFDKPIILLAGGYDKHVSFELLKQYERNVKRVYLFGESANQIKNEAFNGAIICNTLEEAFNLSIKEANKNDTIVLSPGCASYDQFKNFEQRGDVFKQLVLEYKKTHN